MNTYVCGIPGKGKTEGQLKRLLADVGEKAIVVLDPQASLCIRFMMYVLHLLGRVRYIRIRDIDRSLGFIQLKRSTDPNALKRMQEDREHRMLIARLFLGRRALDPSTSPLIWEFLELALRLIQYSSAPLYWLPFCLQPHRREYRWMLKNCRDRETADRFSQIAFWSPTKIRQELSPALRVVETVCLDPAFIAACGTHDLEEDLRQKRIIVVEGQGANRETTRTIILFVLLLTLQFSEKEKSPLHLAVDEVENFDLLTPDVLNGLNTMRKQDVFVTLISQGFLGFEEQVRSKLIQAMSRWEFFCLGAEMAQFAARIIGTPQLSRDTIWYTDQRGRQRHAGYTELNGKLISEYADDIESIEHRMSFGDQVKEHEKHLMTLKVGERYVSHLGRVFKEKAVLLQEPYPWNLSSRKVEQAVQQIQQGPVYQTPSLIGVPESDSSESSSPSTRPPSGKSNGPRNSRVIKPATGRSGNGRGKGSSGKSESPN